MSQMKLHKQCYESCTSIENIKKCIKEGHSVMVLMRGVPGSGKSTIAKNLLESQNGIVCSTDEYFMKNGVYRFDIEMLEKYHKKNQIAARNAISEGITPVIIDNTNITLQEMIPYCIYAASSFYEIYVVEPKNDWSRKAGQCALRNNHGVSKEKIDAMLGRMDLEYKPILKKLLKGYIIELEPTIIEDNDDESPEMKTPRIDSSLNTATTSKAEIDLPPGLFDISQSGIIPVLSLAHDPKLTKSVEMRHISCQTNEITVALNLSGMESMLKDVDNEEIFKHERDTAKKENKDRTTQFPIIYSSDNEKAQAKKKENLDLLVSIYPGEDMATILHFYSTFGLLGAIRNYCDMGIMPDIFADFIPDSFDYDIATALETGSFEHNSAPEGYSDTNTTTASDDSDLSSTLRTVDVGQTFWQELQNLFGPAPYPNAPTQAQISLNVLRQVYDAVIVQQAIYPHEEADAAYARRLYEEEVRSIDRNRPNPYTKLTAAQRITFNKLCDDFVGFDKNDLLDFYVDSNYNDRFVRENLAFHGHEPVKLLNVTSAPKVVATKETSYKQSPVESQTNLMERAQKDARELIDRANEIKKKKNAIIERNRHDKVMKSNYDIDGLREMRKKENDLRNQALDIIVQANKNSKELDLHYLSPKAALEVVTYRINSIISQKYAHPVQLFIITGHGKNRNSYGVVKQTIISWLNNKKYSYFNENDGCIRVIIK